MTLPTPKRKAIVLEFYALFREFPQVLSVRAVGDKEVYQCQGDDHACEIAITELPGYNYTAAKFE